MNKANLNELRQEILEFSYSHELLTPREQTWLITLLIDLIDRTEKKEQIINKIKDYCKYNRERDTENLFYSILNAIEEGQ